jgi:hypothetical protein
MLRSEISKTSLIGLVTSSSSNLWMMISGRSHITLSKGCFVYEKFSFRKREYCREISLWYQASFGKEELKDAATYMMRLTIGIAVSVSHISQVLAIIIVSKAQNTLYVCVYNLKIHCTDAFSVNHKSTVLSSSGY